MNTAKKNVCWMVALGIAGGIATAQEQVIDEITLEERIAEIYPDYGSFRTVNDNVRERVLEGAVSPEWVTATLENLIRKHLPTLEEMRKHDWHFENGVSRSYRTTCQRVTRPVIVLREFPGPDTLALIRECTLSKDSMVSDCAVDTYIAIEGGDSVPFLREHVARGKAGRSGRLSSSLRKFFSAYKKNNRNDDTAKLNAFLLELIQSADDFGDVYLMDRVLCDFLDGYAKSVQRTQAVQRFDNKIPKENYPDSYKFQKKIKEEVEKTPEKERKDFRAKGELLDPDRLKELNERKRE